MKYLIFTMIFILNFSAHARNVRAILLTDNTVIQKNEISRIHFRTLENIDYVELKEGSRVESIDIKKVHFIDQKYLKVERVGENTGF